MNYDRLYGKGPIQPGVQVGENVLLFDGNNYNLYTISSVDSMPRSSPLVFNAGVIGAGAVTVVLNTQNVLDMPYGYYGKYRMRALFDINVEVFQPQAVARGVNQNIISTVNGFTALMDEDDHQSEFYIFENQRIHLRVTNPTRYALAVSYIQFYGFKYGLWGGTAPQTGGHAVPRKAFPTIDAALSSGEKFTFIPISGGLS